MLRFTALAILAALPAAAEVHNLSLKEALALVVRQSPDVVLARIDEQKAQANVKVVKDPFSPKVYGGSGLAYTSGYPSSIEGSAPAIFQVRTDMAIYNRQKAYEVASARENARGAGIDTAERTDDVIFRTASLYVDAAQQARAVKSLQEEIGGLEQLRESVRLRVSEGREIPLASRQAELNLARVRQRFESLSADVDLSEEQLAYLLGFPSGDRVQPTEEEQDPVISPASEEASVSAALEHSREVRRLESQLQAKRLEGKSYDAARLPQVDLVAQYALFAKHNYQDYFLKFQRNNGELGISIRVPILVGTAPSALAMESELDAIRLRTQVSQTRNRVALDTRKAYMDVHRAESARDVAKLDLELAREQVTVLLAQLEEGRTTRAAVDQARLTEQEKWIAFYEEQHAIEKAKLALLKQIGTIRTALLQP